MASSLKRIRWKYNPTESIHLIHLPVISGRHPAPIVNLFKQLETPKIEDILNFQARRKAKLSIGPFFWPG